MISKFNFTTILIIFISTIQAAKEGHKRQMHLFSNNEELVEQVLENLKNILQLSDCRSFPNVLKFTPITIPKAFLPDQEKIISFLEKPIIISDPRPKKIRYTEIIVTGIFEYLEKNKNFIMQECPKKVSRTSHEYFLLRRMCKVIRLMRYLSIDIRLVGNMKSSILRDELIEKVRISHSKLYYALLHIRFTSFLDYVDSSGALFDSSTKLELASNMYSIAIKVLRNTKDVLNQ